MEVTLRAFEAIKTLVTTPMGADSSIFEYGALESHLKSNMETYKALLKNTSRFDELSVQLDAHRYASETIKQCLMSHPTLALYNDFTTEALALLVVLDSNTRTLHMEDMEAAVAFKRSDVQSLPLQAPMALFSVSNSKILRCLLEFVVCLGVYPYLLPGVDTLLKARLRRSQYIAKATNLPCGGVERLLHHTCSVLVDCLDNAVIGPMIVATHVVHILAALVQVCHADGEISIISDGSMKGICFNMLRKLVEGIDQQLVIEELITAMKHVSSNGDTKWLCEVYGEMLSERLMSKNGIQHVITALMNGEAHWV
jgi:hypothetical protein